MSDLNPCPFCGGEAAPTAHLQYSWFAPVCKSCGARGPSVRIQAGASHQAMRELMNKADELWNTRVEPEEQSGKVKPAEQVAAEFKADLQTLLDKFCAELTAKDHWRGYQECGEDVRMTVTVPAIYDADHNCLREFTEIDLGSYFQALREEVKP